LVTTLIGVFLILLDSEKDQPMGCRSTCQFSDGGECDAFVRKYLSQHPVLSIKKKLAVKENSKSNLNVVYTDQIV